MWNCETVCGEQELKEFLNKENIKKWKIIDRWEMPYNKTPKDIFYKIMYWEEINNEKRKYKR